MLTHQDSFFLGRGLPNNVSLVVVDTLRCGEKRHGVKFNLLSKEITRLQGHVSLVEFAVTICILVGTGLELEKLERGIKWKPLFLSIST